VSYHCWWCSWCCACARCCSTIPAVSCQCTDCTSSSSIPVWLLEWVCVALFCAVESRTVVFFWLDFFYCSRGQKKVMKWGNPYGNKKQKQKHT